MDQYDLYFESDYLVNVGAPEVALTFDALRDFADSATLEDSVSSGSVLTESLAISDSFIVNYTNQPTEAITLAESGSIVGMDYVDGTYFESTYVGETLATF
jgi:hypothetical protein